MVRVVSLVPSLTEAVASADPTLYLDAAADFERTARPTMRKSF